jgi:hypothetical protein
LQAKKIMGKFMIALSGCAGKGFSEDNKGKPESL